VQLPPGRPFPPTSPKTILKPFFPSATFNQSNGWLIFDYGVGAQKLGGVLAQNISTPTNGWLSVDMNWPRLAQWYPKLKELGLPETTFEISADATNLLINGKFNFPENLALKLDAWRFPSNTVHQPLVSFTAVRGLAGWLKTQSWAKPYVLSPVQNQAFIWAMNGMPFQIFAAVPVTDAAGALRQLGTQLPPVVAERNAHNGFMAPLTLESTNNELTLIGAPMLAPYVRTVKEPGGEFLLAGGFPNSPRSRPLPPELFQRLATPNLVLYHWEITAERIMPQLQVAQLSLMLTRHKQLEGESMPFKWVFKIAPTLGNTITEIIQTAPDQLTFTRRAPGGLTAFEFLALANWLDAPDFPHCNLELPPPSERLKKIRLKNLQPAPSVSPTPVPGH